MITDDDADEAAGGDYISEIQCLACGAKLPFAVLLEPIPACPECNSVFGRSIYDEPSPKLPNA